MVTTGQHNQLDRSSWLLSFGFRFARWIQNALPLEISEVKIRLFKKVQMRGARRPMSGGVLLYVDAKSDERNEAGEPFSTAWSGATGFVPVGAAAPRAAM